MFKIQKRLYIKNPRVCTHSFPCASDIVGCDITTGSALHVQQWLDALLGFYFTLKYGPGVGSRNVDALLRRPYDSGAASEEWTQLTPEGIQALCQGADYQARSATRAEAIGVSVAGVP